MLTDIALDAMGSDKSPEPELRGAILACRQLPVRVHLVGPEDVLRRGLATALDGERLPIHIVHASEHIGMDEKAANAVRSKRDSSMRVGPEARPREESRGVRDRRQHRAPPWPRPRWCLARCRVLTGRRWPSWCRPCRERLRSCSMWAPTWTASRTTWSSSP